MTSSTVIFFLFFRTKPMLAYAIFHLPSLLWSFSCTYSKSGLKTAMHDLRNGKSNLLAHFGWNDFVNKVKANVKVLENYQRFDKIFICTVSIIEMHTKIGCFNFSKWKNCFAFNKCLIGMNEFGFFVVISSISITDTVSSVW